MEWTNEKLLSFINDYRKCKVLWDIRNPNYKHNGNKRKILITIGQKYGMDEGSVRKKIKNLRSAFHREHHRLMNKIKDDHESEDVRKWFAYDALKFILDVTGPYMTKREDINSAEESFQEEDYDNDEEPFDIRTQYIQLPEETDDSPERTKSPEEQKVSAATSKEEDEYDLFGRSMTMQLRKMPELVALHLMQKMQQMVFNAKKQLIKAKNKTKVRVPPPETHNQSTSKKRVISPSPMPHKSSSQSTPMYKFETISPDDTGAEDNTDKFFYEYMITAEEEKRASQELASENLKQQLKRKGLKSIDPLEVKRSKD